MDRPARSEGRADLAGLPFASAEFADRVTALEAELDRRGLQGAVVVRPENIFYLCGYRAAHIAARTSGFHALVIVPGRRPRLFVRSLERATVRTQWAEPVLFEDHESPYEALSGLLGGMPAVGVEERFLKVAQQRAIDRVLGQAEFRDISGVVEALAAVPSPAEMAAIQHADRKSVV